MTSKSSVSDFGRDHGLIHEAVVTGRKAGWTVDEWAKLAHSEETMQNIRHVLLGHAKIVIPEHVINCDTDPFVPDGWEVVEHQRSGAFKWNAADVALHLDKEQMDGKWIEGDKLRNELANKPVLNANVLDHLLANPHLIPEEWKGKFVFFWGTIYRDQHDNLRVRCLSCRDDRWHWGAGWFGNSWSTRYPAAVSTPEVQQS